MRGEWNGTLPPGLPLPLCPQCTDFAHQSLSACAVTRRADTRACTARCWCLRRDLSFTSVPRPIGRTESRLCRAWFRCCARYTAGRRTLSAPRVSIRRRTIRCRRAPTDGACCGRPPRACACCGRSRGSMTHLCSVYYPGYSICRRTAYVLALGSVHFPRHACRAYALMSPTNTRTQVRPRIKTQAEAKLATPCPSRG